MVRLVYVHLHKQTNKEMKTLSNYQKCIIACTGCNINDAAEVEDYMRNIVLGGACLDGLIEYKFNEVAQIAYNDILFMRTPEGIKMMAAL